MTTLYKDDVTGEVYERDNDLYEYAIVVDNIQFANFDTVRPEDAEKVRAVEEKLHELVSEWADDRVRYIEDPDYE